MFTLTQAAARQIHQAASDSNAQNMALRVAARIEKDGQIEYGMGFDDPKENDMKLDLNGVAVVIGDEHQQLLETTILDFVELQPGEFNFIFMNAEDTPSETDPTPRTGGCGSGGCGSGGCGSKAQKH